jgi:hypothetical protein
MAFCYPTACRHHHNISTIHAPRLRYLLREFWFVHLYVRWSRRLKKLSCPCNSWSFFNGFKRIYIYIYIYSIRGLGSEYWVKLKRLRLVIGIFYGIKYVVFIYMNSRLWRRNNISRISNQDKSIYNKNKLSILYYTHFVLIDQPILDLRVFLIPYNRTN